MERCSMQTAAECVDRLFHSFPTLPEVDLTVYHQSLGNLFMRHETDVVLWAVEQAITKFKKRPTIAHMVELLDKRVKGDEDHKRIIDRYTNYKPPEDIPVFKDTQTKAQRTEFLEACLRRHGFDTVADDLTGKRSRQPSDIAKFEALCRETGVDPASIKDAPSRDNGFGPVGSVLRKM